MSVEESIQPERETFGDNVDVSQPASDEGMVEGSFQALSDSRDTAEFMADRELFSEYRDALRHRSGVRFDRSFFWSLFTTLAGADSALLFHSDWKPPYHNRWDVPYFVGSGAAILTTGVLAAFSSSYFASFLFNSGSNPGEFWPLGVIVGLIIISLDRWLVSDSDVGVDYLPGKSKVATFLGTLFKEFLKLIPRLALTLVMGFLFAEPLLLALFHEDIGAQMQETYQQQVIKLSDDFAESTAAAATAASASLKTLSEQRDAVDPTLQAAIQQQSDVIKNEQINGNGNPRGGTCGAACAGELEVLNGYTSRLAGEKTDFDTAHASEINTANKVLSSTSAIRALSTTEVESLGIYECPYPGTTPSYPVGLPPDIAISITCPQSADSLVQRKVALDELQNANESYVTNQLAALPGASTSAAEGVTTTIGLVRALLVLIDILPVLMKFIRGILPKSGYYLMLSARQAQVDAEASGIRDTAQQGLVASMEATRQAAVVERELRIMEYERMLKTVSESRIRLGLRRIEDFVQTILRRHKESRVAKGSNEPPIFDPGEMVPPPTMGPNKVTAPSPYVPPTVFESDDPRRMDDI